MSKTYDLIIIGGSAAGLSAALFAVRRGLKTLVLTKDIGGQLSSTVDVENYPGIQYIEGFNLASEMQNQAEAQGAKIILDEVKLITKKAKLITVKTNQQEYQAKTLILAHGKTPRSLNIPGEKEFLGRGVSYCAGCDIKNFKNKEIVIVGGGSAAFEGAKLAGKICKKIYLIHRNDTFRAEKVTIEGVKKMPNVEIITNSQLHEIIGDKNGVNKIMTKTGNEMREISAQGVFIEIGFEIQRGFTEKLVETDNINQIIVNHKQETSTVGIFAAGDVTNVPYNQAIISAAEGAKAALSAWSYLNNNKPVGGDWGKI